LTLAICLSPCFLKVKGRIAARSHAAAGLQGCGSCGRGGVLAPKAGNDKESEDFSSPSPAFAVPQEGSGLHCAPFSYPLF
jgi:hypothetical protein